MLYYLGSYTSPSCARDSIVPKVKGMLYSSSIDSCPPTIAHSIHYLEYFYSSIYHVYIHAKCNQRNHVHKVGNDRCNRKRSGAAQKMNDKRISSVLVVDGDKQSGEPIGIVTERDLVIRVCAKEQAVKR